MKCPTCKTEFKPTKKDLASEFSKLDSPAKRKASRENGKRGGRPKGSKNKVKTNIIGEPLITKSQMNRAIKLVEKDLRKRFR